MSTPDLSGYVDLTLYDKNPQDIYDVGLTWIQLHLPDFIPYEGTIETVLLEAMAQQVAELSFAVNRLPGAIASIFFQLYGITRFIGAPATANATFTLQDTFGHLIPAGTKVQLPIDDAGNVITFTTDAAAQVAEGTSSITTSMTASQFGSQPNGFSIGTHLNLVDALFFVDEVTLASIPINGEDVEDTPTWLSRASAVLSRLSSVLARPEHFTAFVLEDPHINRAFSIDRYNAGWRPPRNVHVAPSATGGTLLAGGAYGYAITTTTAGGESNISLEITANIPSGGGDTGSAVLTWTAPPVAQNSGTATGYKIYRRNPSGSLGIIHTVGSPTTLTYTDTNGTAPTTAPPVLNTTADDDQPGYVTTAVYGPDTFISDDEKDTLTTEMSALAQANLWVTVIDPIINVVNVTAVVVASDGFSDTQAIADATAAVQSLLSPEFWPFAQVLPLNKIIAVIGAEPSVAYVSSITVPSGDVTLSGIAPLTTPGTITITAA